MACRTTPGTPAGPARACQPGWPGCAGWLGRVRAGLAGLCRAEGFAGGRDDPHPTQPGPPAGPAGRAAGRPAGRPAGRDGRACQPVGRAGRDDGVYSSTHAYSCVCSGGYDVGVGGLVGRPEKAAKWAFPARRRVGTALALHVKRPQAWACGGTVGAVPRMKPTCGRPASTNQRSRHSRAPVLNGGRDPDGSDRSDPTMCGRRLAAWPSGTT